jgi:hypothetical protein
MNMPCRTCGKPALFGLCRECGKKECEKGNHSWDPVALGPGVAIFDCLFCDATSDGSLEPLKQLGFREVKLKDKES